MKIGYYPAGGRDLASSRLRVYAIADVLAARGHAVTFNPSDPLSCDVVVVQKRGDCAEIMARCQAAGVRTVFDVDDYLEGFDVSRADVVTADTPAKRTLYPQAVIIPDALDAGTNAPVKTAHADTFTRAVWFGNAENLYHIQPAASACDALGIDLTVITDLDRAAPRAETYGVRGVQWTPFSVDAELIEADVVLLPFVLDGGAWSRAWVTSKSANRVLKAWALGLPVAATPIPSYVDIGVKYLASTETEWRDALTALQDRAARERDAAYGRLIAQFYTAERLADVWLGVFEGKPTPEPIVTPA